MATGFIFDARFREHDTGRYHPERAERMDAAMAELEKTEWYSNLLGLEADFADIATVETTHSLAYIRRAQVACRDAAPYLDTPDVAISQKSYDIAMLAAGTPIVLADALVAGRIRNGFALLRPPGHHAERAAAMGFCLFNNVAVLARYLQNQHGLSKIAIVDWDVHHGNGTQHSFDSDPSVLYISTHQYPYYPGTGAAAESGSGAGRGATLNCPMPAGAGDLDYEAAFVQKIIPKLNAFKPECLIVSAGFDAHRDDPLADIQLSTPMFDWMTMRLLEVADRHCAGRLLSVLEGGYHLQRLGECVAAHLSALQKASAG